MAPRDRERKFMTSSKKQYIYIGPAAHNIAAKIQHSNTTFNYNIYTDVDIHINPLSGKLCQSALKILYLTHMILYG